RVQEGRMIAARSTYVNGDGGRAIPCRQCPACQMPTAVCVAANGRGAALYRCVHCGARHDGPFPGQVLGESRSRCVVCQRPIRYRGRGRRPKRCKACKGES
ncbi:MAG TPA: hypothetical protein VF158_00800, partial [Longimicrobiales bacterium]